MSRCKPAVIHLFIPLVLAGVAGGLTEGMASLHLSRLNLAAGAAAWVGASYYLALFVFSPVLGKLSDRIGRRRVILLSPAAILLGYLLLAFDPSQAWVLVVFYVTSAIAYAAQISVSQASIADISAAEDRTAHFGIVMAAYPLSALFTRYLMGQWDEGVMDFLYESKCRNAWLVAAGVTVLSMLYVALILPESLAPENRKPWRWAGAEPFSAVIRLKRWPAAAALSVVLFGFTLATAVMPTLWTRHMHISHDWNLREIGLGATLTRLSFVVALLFLLRWIVGFLGERKCIYAGLLITAATMAVFGFSSNRTMLWMFTAIGGFGGIALPAALSLITTRVPKDEQGAVQGTLQCLFALGGFLGAILWSWIASRDLKFDNGINAYGLSFIGATALTVVATGMVWRVFKKEMIRRDAGGVDG